LSNVLRRVADDDAFRLAIGLFLLSACLATRKTSGLPQELPLPTRAELSGKPDLATDWANRVMADDPRVRANAEAALVQGAERSLPLLRQFLDRRNEG
jgi:hypothetical protein